MAQRKAAPTEVLKEPFLRAENERLVPLLVVIYSEMKRETR